MTTRRAAIDPRDHMRLFQRDLRRRGIRAALIVSRVATHWLTGFRGTASFTVVPSRGEPTFLTDFRYIETARASLAGMRIVEQAQGAGEQIARLLARHTGERLALEGCLPHDQWLWARRLLPPGARVANATLILSALRAVKSEPEITAIRRAVRVGDAIFQDAIPWLRRRLRRGALTESEVARWLRREFEERWGEGPSFPPIVATGANSALPHATPGNRPIRTGHFLLLDFGLVLSGHCSDMTRTLVIGKPSRRQRQTYEIVLEAQLAALGAVRAGVRARDVDGAAREVIRRAGHGDRFGHGTGHGVGLEIHEAPRIASTSKERLQAGMVITIEPGIYLPGFGGVRIEDMVVVRRGGADILTQSPKELISL
ncbi:aminopeptidase P family protein [Candidatus Sumerlaeota bacterium]|nr:aminopeptidase P family protein [Candidatus Sumerlaeota bacterium]